MTAEAGAPDGRTACTVDELLIEARSSLSRRPSPGEALAAQATGALLIDIRGDDQRRTCGKIPGALLLPRNALEWRCDPTGQWRHPAMKGLNQHLILICQEGFQSSLAAANLQRLGLVNATDMDGGFAAWAAAGLPVISDPVNPSLVPSVRTVDTRFTHLVGCRLPFQLAVLGGVGTTELSAAVSAGGGLGMVPYGVEPSPAELGPSGTGFLIPYLPPVEVIAEAASRVSVVEFFQGDPDERLVRAGHSAGALVSWQVGSADEGRAAEAAGCDLVVAQGVEAGGHVRGKTPLGELLPAMLAAVGVPVIAAGGIGTAERAAALLAAGADAVRVGTRFLACPECNTHPAYVEALLAAGAGDTVVTRDLDDGGHWPAAVRVLGSSLAQARRAGNRSTMPPTRQAEDPLAMACYAGMSVADLTRIQPAAEVLRDLANQL